VTEVSRKTQYALLAAVDLAAHYGPRSLVSLSEIAARTGLSRKYLGQMLLLLKRRMLVHSTRGAKGGYRLMRRPELINVAEVIEAVAAGRRGPADGRPPGAYKSALDWLTQQMAGARRALLADLTLADLVQKAKQSQ
jgi:Rrf2 family protein